MGKIDPRMRRPVALLTLLLLQALGPAAEARNEAGDWELGVHLGTASFIDTEVEGDTLWGLDAGYCFTDLFELGLRYDRVSTTALGGTPGADLDFLTLDFIYNLGEDAHRPYLLFGLGRLDVESKGAAAGSPLAGGYDTGVIDVGLGYRGYFNRTVGARLDLRLSFSDESGGGMSPDNRDWRWSLGLTFNLRP